MPSSVRSLVVALAVVCAAPLAATRSSAAPAIALKGGLSASTLHGSLPTDNLFSNGLRYGFGAGVSLTVNVTDALAIQPEALYVTKGTSLGDLTLTDSNGNPMGTYGLTTAVDFVELPVLARIGLPSPGRVSPYLLIGPAVGIRVSQKIQFALAPAGSFDIDDFRRADLGLALGSGFELGSGPLRGLLEARYTIGVTAIGRDSYSDSARNGDLLVMTGIAIRP